MGIILFLVDTSASMNQRTFLGTSYLDVAKGAIDTFMKVRTRGRGGCGIFVPPCEKGIFFTHTFLLRYVYCVIVPFARSCKSGR
jgi:hypothetical protein